MRVYIIGDFSKIPWDIVEIHNSEVYASEKMEELKKDNWFITVIEKDILDAREIARERSRDK